MDFSVSVVQFQPQLLDPQANLIALSSMLSGLKTDLAVLPELCLSGYALTSLADVDAMSEEVPDGIAYQSFQALAWEKRMSIVYGFIEKRDGKYYNACALVNPDGSGYVYRKTHLYLIEKRLFSPGNTGLKVYPAKHGVKVGMMICFDWQFPEAARTLALNGAQIICHPSNLVLPWCQQAMLTRSLENRVFSVTSNRIGEEPYGSESFTFTGQSQIIGTKGEILTRLGESETGVHTCQIDPDLALDKTISYLNNAFTDRRPELYEL